MLMNYTQYNTFMNSMNMKTMPHSVTSLVTEWSILSLVTDSVTSLVTEWSILSLVTEWIWSPWVFLHDVYAVKN